MQVLLIHSRRTFFSAFSTPLDLIYNAGGLSSVVFFAPSNLQQSLYDWCSDREVERFAVPSPRPGEASTRQLYRRATIYSPDTILIYKKYMNHRVYEYFPNAKILCVPVEEEV